tara:strand:+ start:223 stop:408 length:186 start_codon:yes stop_codon:yes gene_type:complete
MNDDNVVRIVKIPITKGSIFQLKELLKSNIEKYLWTVTDNTGETILLHMTNTNYKGDEKND